MAVLKNAEDTLFDVTTPASITGDLTLGHIFAAAGLDPSHVVVLRHTYNVGGIETPADVTPQKLLDYTRRQNIGNKLGATPPFIWLNFMADGGRRSRYLVAYENHGEVLPERSAGMRYFDLRPTDVLASLKNRLVVEWSHDAVNWAKLAATSSSFPVVEIADTDPGTPRRQPVKDSRWRRMAFGIGASCTAMVSAATRGLSYSKGCWRPGLPVCGGARER